MTRSRPEKPKGDTGPSRAEDTSPSTRARAAKLIYVATSPRDDHRFGLTVAGTMDCNGDGVGDLVVGYGFRGPRVAMATPR